MKDLAERIHDAITTTLTSTDLVHAHDVPRFAHALVPVVVEQVCAWASADVQQPETELPDEA